jgi:hypothetical protein
LIVALLARDQEVRSIEDALAAACVGEAKLLVVEGEAGFGTSARLTHAHAAKWMRSRRHTRLPV